MKKAQKIPCYIAGCDDQYQLKNAIDTMILDLLKNLEAGYDLNVDVVIEEISNGITLQTYNMLTLNINKELKKQEKTYEINSISGMAYNSTTLH